MGSELCSRKEHTHRMIEVPSVSHAAWAYWQTGKSLKMLKREGRVGVSVGQPGNHAYFSLKLTVMYKNEMMTMCEFLQACRKHLIYGAFIFRIGCLREKKYATCMISSAFCTNMLQTYNVASRAGMRNRTSRAR